MLRLLDEEAGPISAPATTITAGLPLSFVPNSGKFNLLVNGVLGFRVTVPGASGVFYTTAGHCLTGLPIYGHHWQPYTFNLNCAPTRYFRSRERQLRKLVIGSTYQVTEIWDLDAGLIQLDPLLTPAFGIAGLGGYVAGTAEPVNGATVYTRAYRDGSWQIVAGTIWAIDDTSFQVFPNDGRWLGQEGDSGSPVFGYDASTYRIQIYGLVQAQALAPSSYRRPILRVAPGYRAMRVSAIEDHFNVTTYIETA